MRSRRGRTDSYRQGVGLNLIISILILTILITITINILIISSSIITVTIIALNPLCNPYTATKVAILQDPQTYPSSQLRELRGLVGIHLIQ